MIERDPNFLVEVWTLYGIGMTLLLVRFATRVRIVGLKGLQGDDFFAMGVTIFYTLDALLVHITYKVGTNLDFTQPEIDMMTQSERDKVVFGSKMQLFAWYSYTALIWCLKGTMICFFNRLTIGTWQQKWIKYITISCVLSYIAVFLTVSTGCRPYADNWKVHPLPSTACTGKPQNLIVTAIFNVLTDAMLLAIPLPLLWKLKVPLRQKLVIAVLLSSGVFVITAAVLRVAFSSVAHPSVLILNSWGVRETIVGVLSVNVPILRPLFRREFWSKNSTIPSNGMKSTQGYHGMNSSKQKSGRTSTRMMEDNDSSDFIVGNKNDIVMETTIEVRHSDNTPGTGGSVPTSEWKYGGENGVEARAAV